MLQETVAKAKNAIATNQANLIFMQFLRTVLPGGSFVLLGRERGRICGWRRVTMCRIWC
jgi:hypothetical protein